MLFIKCHFKADAIATLDFTPFKVVRVNGGYNVFKTFADWYLFKTGHKYSN